MSPGDHQWHTSYILMSCWPVLSGRMHDAFYLLSHVSLLVGNLCVLPPRKHHDHEKQLFLKDPLKEAQILKSMSNKHIVVIDESCLWKSSCHDARVRVFWFFTIQAGRSCKLTLQDYFDHTSAREEMVSSFACSHNKIDCHTSTERCWQRISTALSFFFCIIAAIQDALLNHSHIKSTRVNDWEICLFNFH